jgi:hypothetical protein
MKTARLTLQQRTEAFAALGDAMREAAAGAATGRSGLLSQLADNIFTSNPWFTPENVRLALRSIGNSLTYDNLGRWLSRYPEINEDYTPCDVGVVMAGNIPLVGFHDLLCVLITGNRIQARLSTKDELLMRAVAGTLISAEPGLSGYIDLTTDRLTRFDMVIATGSNNTSRYFEYYFRNVPSIIRRNRNSVAILDGTETDNELALLGDDIFSYFGLGCRNVSKLFLPEGYDVKQLPGHWMKYGLLRGHSKYSVNYDHNKAVMMVNREQFTDGGFILMKPDPSFTPPMAVVNYEFYSSPDAPERETVQHKNRLQCVAGHRHLPFGSTQQPELWDFADDIDTIGFLLKKNATGRLYIKKY